MALTYLSGDDYVTTKDYIAGKRSGKSSGGGKKSGGSKRSKKTPEQKKAGRKRVFKGVAKVALAPSRASFLTIVRLNALHLATKLARVWNRPNGKETIIKFWEKFGGDVNKLKEVIRKGSKNKVAMRGDQIGSATAVGAAIASATPIIVALVPIIKQFKAGGDKKEAAEFNEGVEQGKQDLADNEDVPKAKVSMPRNKEVGYMTDKNGYSQTDEKYTGRKESESGGSDGSGAGRGDSSGGGDGDGDKGGERSEEEKEKEAKAKMGSNFSPLGMFFMMLMYSSMYFNQQSIFVMLLNTYCTLGIILIPVAITKNPLQKIAKVISYTPINVAEGLINTIKLRWQKKLA